MSQAGKACRREGLVFVPMSWETLGGWHAETVAQVKKLASAHARQTVEEQSEATRHLYQKLSVLLFSECHTVQADKDLLRQRLPLSPWQL